MTAPAVQQALDRMQLLHPKSIDLSLDRIRRLLQTLGAPDTRLPPVLHVAGTNGKGSTLAFLRGLLEASGRSVHAYTSPHLVTFNERIRISGRLIDDDALLALLEEVAALNAGEPITFFEITTALAFLAFARNPADVLLLETGLGGRLDATNVLPHPLATGITRISFDHHAMLGDRIDQIAREKAGILKAGVPAVFAEQPNRQALDTLLDAAGAAGAPVTAYGSGWHVAGAATGAGFRYTGPARTLDLPAPSLAGRHQWMNAGTAITMLDRAGFELSDSQIADGVQRAEWPARLQRLKRGPLVDALPAGWELWLDGGHNDSGGEVLAAHAAGWSDRPLHLVFGMMANKQPEDFLRDLARHLASATAVPIPGEDNAYPASVPAEGARSLQIPVVREAADALAAVRATVAAGGPPSRILIAGSLYLAGWLLRDSG